MRFDQRYIALTIALKKKIKTFYHFSRHFPVLEICWANLNQNAVFTKSLSPELLIVSFQYEVANSLIVFTWIGNGFPRYHARLFVSGHVDKANVSKEVL